MSSATSTFRTYALLFAVVVLVPLSGLQAQADLAGSDSMPAALSLPDINKQGPTWMALDAAFLPTGDLRSDEELPPGAGVALRAMMRARTSTATGCVQWRSSEYATPGREDLESAIAEAKSILQATVTGVTPGLWYGHLGSLFRVELDEVLKDFASRQPMREHYVFVRAGEFRLQDRRVCLEGREYSEQLPAVGDQVLLLSDGWEPSHPVLTTGGGSGFVGLTSDGHALVPQRYLRAESALTHFSADDVLARILNTLGGSR